MTSKQNSMGNNFDSSFSKPCSVDWIIRLPLDQFDSQRMIECTVVGARLRKNQSSYMGSSQVKRAWFVGPENSSLEILAKYQEQ